MCIRDRPKTQVSTIAKFLGYEEEIKEDGTKVVHYNYNQIKNGPSPNVLIIDECSMISIAQLEALKETKINIIFVGDICQINPVSEDISQVFNCNFLGKASLIKNERIKNPELKETILNYRDSVIKGHLLKKCIESPARINNRDQFNKELLTSFHENDETVFIAWTNVQVKEYNLFLRNSLFNDPKEPYVSGERLQFNNYYKGTKHNFYSGQKVTIDECEKVERVIFFPNCMCNNSNYKVIHTERPECSYKINKCEKCKTPSSMSNYKTFDFWKITLVGHEEEYFLKPVEGMKNIYPIIYKYRDRCKALKNKIEWRRYYDIIDILNTPLEYSYSISVHKAQGSGYDNVFVDLENIMFCQNTQERLRLAYTAVSRARENLYFLK